jgi:tetratricopeptide (TPR) repeat protein
MDRGRYETATDLLIEVRNIRTEEYETDYKGLWRVLELLARSRRLLGDLQAAAELGHQVLQLTEVHGDSEGPDILMAMANLATTQRYLGKLEEAERVEEEVLRLRQIVMDAENPDVLTAMAILAITKGKLGKLEEAEYGQRSR